MATKTPALPVDQTLVEHSFVRGIVRDTDSIPPGGVFNAFDLLINQNGTLVKRGGWSKWSNFLGGFRCNWVGAINVPNKLIAIDSNNTLFDVTTWATATSIASVGFAPREHSSQYINRIILCDPAAVQAPKKAYTSGGVVTVAAWGGSPPPAAFSTVYAGRVVLGRGTTDLQRIYFSALPDVESSWKWDVSVPASPAYSYIDTSYDITGLAAVGGVMLIFSAQHVERILGGVPPAEEGSDMQLQPVAGVGCLDARSIVLWDNNVIFAGEEGVWFSNGSGVDSLTEKPDGTGIQQFWSSLFPRDQQRFIVGGLFNRDFYLVEVADSNYNLCETLLCHLPSRSWTRIRNVCATSLVQARSNLGVLDLYSGDGSAPYVNRLTDILNPSAANAIDGNGDPVEWSLETRPFDGDSASLKAYGFGRVSYNQDISGFPLRQNSHAYPLYVVVELQNHLYYCIQAGTTAASPPFMDGVLGTHYPDGTVVWECVDPIITVTRLSEIGKQRSLFLRDLRQYTHGPKVFRDRFDCFGDYQSVSLLLEQHGPTARTFVDYIELEARPYAPAADFNTGPEAGTVVIPPVE